MTKPSERVVKAPYDGLDVKDSLGRIIKMRKPSLLDTYDLMKALGEDAKNEACVSMASSILYVGMIDGVLVESPRSLSEVRMILKRLDDEGLAAIGKVLLQYNSTSSEAEAVEREKK